MSGLQGKRVGMVCTIAIVAGLWASAASADAIYGSFNILATGTHEGDSTTLGLLSQQLGVLVEANETQATFTFENALLPSGDTVYCVITEIYWSQIDPPLLNYADSYVLADQWSRSTKPKMPSQYFAVAFEADVKNPAPHNGVKPGESVAFTFALNSAPYTQPDDLISALSSGVFQLGMKVQAFLGGGSDTLVASFIDLDDQEVPAVPVPAAAGLGFLGMGLVGLLKGYQRIRR
jgi:hypothetical protein